MTSPASHPHLNAHASSANEQKTLLTRKAFLRTSLAAGATALIAPGRAAAAVKPGSPNDDIRVAVVGFRSKGVQHIRMLREMAGVKVAALCDVDTAVLAREVAKIEADGEKVATYTDCRKLLDDSSIDAIVIATPNHWHSLLTVWACQAGKDVYVEKPISHNIWEGRKAVEAAARYNRIVQAGTQSRSDTALQEAFAWLKAGNLGAIQWARGLCYKLRPSIGKTSGPQPVPPTINYDLWTGPAPLVPPRRNSEKFGPVHYDWHWFWNYGGGDIANQGIHEVDMCRWALGEDGLPPSVTSIGGRFGYDDDAETPNTQIAIFNYEKAPIIFEVRGLPRKRGMNAMDAYRGRRIGFVVQCEDGYLAGGGGGAIVHDNDGKRVHSFESEGGRKHMANFIAAVRSRKQGDLNAPILEGQMSTSLCHLANISYRLGHDEATDKIRAEIEGSEPFSDSFARMLENLEANEVPTASTPVVFGPTLRLIPGEERFVSDEDYDLGYWANTMLKREGRKPFTVPETV